MKRSRLTWTAALSAGCLAFIVGNCRPQEPPVEEATPVQEATPVPPTVGRVVTLEQGWNEQQRQWFWFTSQGSRLVPYDWFLALEQAESAEPFRSDANMDRLRYLLAKPSQLNPDGLPVGFTKDTDPATGQAWMGWTCAACHTNQIDYKGTGMLIDGAPTLADGSAFLNELAAAMQATKTDDAKFERFARKVLGQGYDAGKSEALHRDLVAAADALSERMRQDTPQHPYGYARLDAFGSILNQVIAADLGIPENYKPADAPVSYPVLWDTPQSDRVQWNGSAPNAGIGPLARNVGEILGVFGTVSIEPANGPKGYASSARVPALVELEKSLESLWSPLWPAVPLPAIDSAKAASGQAIYQQQCANCHHLIDRNDPARRVTAVMTPIAELGTDSTMAANLVTRTGKTGRLEGHKAFILGGPPFGPVAGGGQIVGNAVIGTILGQKIEGFEAGFAEYVKARSSATFDPRSYKARPLNGIWAAAPYLHNGSVPNLWQLLQAPDKRVKEFYVGSRELDPVNVGFDTAPFPGGFKFDTTLPANSNGGHTYGTTLPDEQKWALIEYLKTL
jgi:mono/diheme cytochrome c family protein